uniref:Nitronate monooxygenase domain-containing protein n=1 Tax=Grammatophora oceanica TaxID=210454 RepID=A0A7S1VL68_9STRA|mmetsp:Transcript_4771/g.6646  ORF Transcript_4771/g.6646 Transcript_4771/m.6646 type:complete len:343 (+) Transcript_4771:151-1179(+)|eukprot:CAMPEP_0194046494 /NCGR_PEP_ID=MMETSP0009_2-20130614/21295_1 /TAXON_ID=210454 /ORGANISM="Grammatophora oceanica, Strain CCMP 410" /LENGTH=342 /DNA_ID=CAMNT_0038691809 /DNA_START=146 /DNA_END=1174 /DNA_ORIENTATION=-
MSPEASPMIETRITKMLGIQHPIVMGGLTGAGTPELAAAVSNAGGLGMIAIHNAGSPEAGRVWIKKLRRLCQPNRPFGVNLTILPTMGPPPPYMEYANVIVEEGVKIVETAGSSPKQFVKFFRDAGLITIHKCVSIRHALSAERYGVDIISLDGMECAGHPGEEDVGNFVLQAKGAKALTRPYLCSGGVGDGKQLAAALALGADGVNCGTRFCATKECNWPESFKRRVMEANETDTVLMLRRLNNTCRVFRNKVAEEVEEIESKKGDDFDFSDVAHLVSGKRGREAERNGDPDGGIWTAGQVIGLVDTIPTCAELVDTMMKEAVETIQGRLSSLVVGPRSRL